MITLGIETSCDETSVAVVENGRKVLSNEVVSSLRYHTRYGGVIPEIASRMQLEAIIPVSVQALKKARRRLKDIGLISVTRGPGLMGSLVVGVSFAKSLALALNRPIIGVDHVVSHIYANFLTAENIPRPFVALVVSGGHTSLFEVRDFHDILLLGKTRDDACGEAFDKVAKLLGLAYPGGPQIEALAAKGNPGAVKFRCSGTQGEFDFSFSGIKTAVMYYLRDESKKSASVSGTRLSADVAASFQEAVVDVLVRKSLAACRKKKSSHLVVGGGVALNNRLREKMHQSARAHRINCHFPVRTLCMDNAAMVAGLGYQLFRRGISSTLDMEICC